MKSRLFALRLLAMLVIASQGLLPMPVAAAQGHGLDISSIMCAADGQFTPPSRATAERLAAILDDEAPQEHLHDNDCPLCTLAHGAPLPERIALRMPFAFSGVHTKAIYEPGFVHLPQGPPLGSRGPPETLKTIV
jgi:hypothetical protein